MDSSAREGETGCLAGASGRVASRARGGRRVAHGVPGAAKERRGDHPLVVGVRLAPEVLPGLGDAHHRVVVPERESLAPRHLSLLDAALDLTHRPVALVVQPSQRLLLRLASLRLPEYVVHRGWWLAAARARGRVSGRGRADSDSMVILISQIWSEPAATSTRRHSSHVLDGVVIHKTRRHGDGDGDARCGACPGSDASTSSCPSRIGSARVDLVARSARGRLCPRACDPRAR